MPGRHWFDDDKNICSEMLEGVIMAASYTAGAARQTVAVSAAGSGVAKQFRVQYQEASASLWRQYATFGRRQQAEECLNALLGQGLQARMIPFMITPVSV